MITKRSLPFSLLALALTWTSEPGKLYAIDASSNLETWPGDIDDSVSAAEESTTTSYTFGNASLEDRQFFRIREVPN